MSRRVRMPTSLPPRSPLSVMGTPEMRCRAMSSRTRAGLVGSEGERVGDHAVGRAFDLGDLADLVLGGEVLVDHPEPAFLGQSDGEAGSR